MGEAGGKTVEDVINNARALKTKALTKRESDCMGAIQDLAEAESELRASLSELRNRRLPGDKPGDDEMKIVKQLPHILGSRGGVWRIHKLYIESIACYDAGYEFEELSDENKFENSYTLIQRLVARVFLDPQAISLDRDVRGLKLRTALELAKTFVQQRKAKKPDDEYALADYAVVLLLLNEPNWLTTMDEFANKASPYAGTTTLKMLDDLCQAVASKCGELNDLATRLKLAMEKLERFKD